MARTKPPTFPNITTDELIDTEQAAKRLGLSPNTLIAWRANRVPGLPYYVVGRRIKYRIQDLNDYVSSKRIIP